LSCSMVHLDKKLCLAVLRKPLENLEVVWICGERMKLTDGRVRWLYEKQKTKQVYVPWKKDFDISLEEFWAGSDPKRYPDVWKWDLG